MFLSLLNLLNQNWGEIFFAAIKRRRDLSLARPQLKVGPTLRKRSLVSSNPAHQTLLVGETRTWFHLIAKENLSSSCLGGFLPSVVPRDHQPKMLYFLKL